MRPLCIDLFCGLVSRQTEFFLRADPAVQQLVTGRAKHPDHVRLAVLHLAPRAVPTVLRAVREFNNPTLATRLASGWNRREATTNARHDARVLERPARVVGALAFRVPALERPTLLLRGLTRATLRAVAAITRRWRDIEVFAADPAVSACPRDVGLLVPSQPADARLTPIRAVTLIRSLRREAFATAQTE